MDRHTSPRPETTTKTIRPSPFVLPILSRDDPSEILTKTLRSSFPPCLLNYLQNSVFDLKRANESSKLNSLKRRQIDRLPAPGGFVPPGSTELALRA